MKSSCALIDTKNQPTNIFFKTRKLSKHLLQHFNMLNYTLLELTSQPTCCAFK